MDAVTPPVIAYVALGSNLGARLVQLRTARRRLAEWPGVTVRGSSALYRTAAVGGPPGQEDYLNAVLEVATALSAEELLAACLAIEADLGRMRGERWGARSIDLDLLLYGARIAETAALTLPHPRLHERRFVLLPLADLAAGLRHPRLGCPIADLAATAPDTGAVLRLQEDW